MTLERHRRCGLILAAAACLVGCSRGVSEETPGRLDDAARETLVETLRTAVRDETGPVRVQAAEALIRHGYAAEVLATFHEEAETAEPEQRIGVWRVIAEATRDSGERRAMMERTREAFADEGGADRVSAAESLAKLGYRVTAEDRPLFERAASDPGLAAFSRWVLAASGDAVQRDAVVSLLASEDAVARLQAADALRALPGQGSPREFARIERVALREPEDSPARVALLGAAWESAPTPGDAERAAGLVREAATDGGAERRRHAASLLGERGTAEDVPLLTARSGDADPGVRVAAADALLRIERRIPHRMGIWDWGVVAAYAVGMLLIGSYYSRQVTTTDDYLLGGRNMKSWAVGISLFAALISTISTLTWPGEVIMHGPMMLSGLLAYPLILYVVGWFLIPFFMKLQVTSAYEILEIRLGLSVRMLGSSLFLTLRLLWMAVIIHATTATVIVPITGAPPWTGPWISALMGIITVVYTVQGGLRAVVATEVVQSGILFGGALLTMAVVTHEVGGFAAWWPDVWPTHWQQPTLGFDPSARVTLAGAFIASFTWFVCTAGSDQMAIQRYLATRDVAAARTMFGISLLSAAVVQVFLGFLGLALLAYFQTHRHMLADGQSVDTHADQLFPRFIVSGLPAGICGLMVAGLVAAAMDSLSSGVNSTCSVVTVDFLDRFRRNRESKPDHLRSAKYVSAAIGIAVVALSSLVGFVRGNLLEIAYKVVNLFVAPLFGLFFMAMFVRGATAFGTIVGAAAGLTVAIGVNYWQEITGTAGISFLWAMPLSLLAQIVVGTLASRLPIGRPPAPPSSLLRGDEPRPSPRHEIA